MSSWLLVRIFRVARSLTNTWAPNQYDFAYNRVTLVQLIILYALHTHTQGHIRISKEFYPLHTDEQHISELRTYVLNSATFSPFPFYFFFLTQLLCYICAKRVIPNIRFMILFVSFYYHLRHGYYFLTASGQLRFKAFTFLEHILR